MRGGTGTLATMIVLVSSSCASHPRVRLRAPPRDAPAPVRMEAYEQLRPRPELAYLDEKLDHLRLRDGLRVYHPTDILPVVPSRSRAAIAAVLAEKSENLAGLLLWGGGGLMLAGVGMTAYGWSSSDDFLSSGWFGISLSVFGAGAVLAALSAIPEWRANDHTHDAFVYYDRALRHRLHLCVRAGAVVPCEER